MEMRVAMQRVAGKRRLTLAGDHQHQPRSATALTAEEFEEPQPRLLDACAMKIEARRDLHLAARHPPFAPAIEASQGRRLAPHRMNALRNARSVGGLDGLVGGTGRLDRHAGVS